MASPPPLATPLAADLYWDAVSFGPTASYRVHAQAPQRRLAAFFAGRVQGVGFRYTTCRVAGRFAVTGFVKNLPDGRVELVAEGDREELDRFLAAVQQEMAGYVTDTQTADAAATGEFREFGVAW